tara:strand:+ start:1252 stop:1401 length:150 start_codon:yes stop_codon:yes gene_type:complete
MQKTIHAVLEAITEVLEHTTTNGNVTSAKLEKAKKEVAKAKANAGKKED